jgi:hypothetical protein
VGISWFQVSFGEIEFDAIVQDGEGAETLLDAFSDLFLDSVGSIQDALNAGGLATGSPDPPEGLLEVCRAPAWTDECGARETTVQVMQAHPYATRPKVGDDDPRFVELKCVNVALPLFSGLITPDD